MQETMPFSIILFAMVSRNCYSKPSIGVRVFPFAKNVEARSSFELHPLCGAKSERESCQNSLGQCRNEKAIKILHQKNHLLLSPNSRNHLDIFGFVWICPFVHYTFMNHLWSIWHGSDVGAIFMVAAVSGSWLGSRAALRAVVPKVGDPSPIFTTNSL